jgi:ATP-dependent DNA helicase RecG
MDVKILIKQGESETLEFKESLQLKDEIGETVSAFSNLKGGVILVGVSDKGKIKGVQIGRKTLTELAEYIKKNTDPRIYPEVSTSKIENRTIISIKTKEADEKPVFFKSHAYKRVGDTTQRISSSEIRKLVRESKGKIYWDEQICEETSLKDIDEEKVRWFLKKAKSERNLNIDPTISVKEALTRLKLIKVGKLTRAAILLFGKEPQRFFTQAEIRCARFRGTEAVKPFVDMKVFSGNIIDQVNKSLNFVLEHIPLSVWLISDKVEREEKYEYPPEAIREAIVNAICHRDYESTANVQVRIFDDRVEIWNPGSLPEGWTVEKLKQIHESIPKNPLIAHQFFLVRFIEKWGIRGLSSQMKF